MKNIRFLSGFFFFFFNFLVVKFSVYLNRLVFVMCQQLLAFAYLLAEIFTCSAMFSKKELAIASNLRFTSRTNFIHS